MADKAGTIYTVKSFKVNLDLIPNFQVLGVAIKDLKAKLSKSIADKVKSEPLLETMKAYETNGNKFDDAINTFKIWADKALEVILPLDDAEFISHRGRDTSTLMLTLFGQKGFVPDLAAGLIKGSPLETLLKSGPKALDANFADGSFKDLHTVFNSLKNSMTNAIPDSAKQTRTTKAEKEAAAKAEADAKAEAEKAVAQEGEKEAHVPEIAEGAVA